MPSAAKQLSCETLRVAQGDMGCVPILCGLIGQLAEGQLCGTDLLTDVIGSNIHDVVGYIAVQQHSCGNSLALAATALYEIDVGARVSRSWLSFPTCILDPGRQEGRSFCFHGASHRKHVL